MGTAGRAQDARGRRGCGSRRGAGAGGMDLDATLLAAGPNASNTSAGPDNLTAAGEWGRGEPAPSAGGAGEASPLSPTAWETFLRAPQPAGLRGKGRGALGRGAGACGAPSRGSPPRPPRALQGALEAGSASGGPGLQDRVWGGSCPGFLLQLQERGPSHPAAPAAAAGRGSSQGFTLRVTEAAWHLQS